MFGEIKLPPGSPWDWVNLTDRQELDLHILETNQGSKAPALQYHAVKQCRKLQAGAVGGDGFDTLTCIRLCAEHGLVIPDWLATAFKSKYDPVHNLEVGSWDHKKSFGRPYPVKTQLKALREKRRLAGQIWYSIAEKIEVGKAPSNELIDLVGTEFSIKRTTAWKHYRYALDHLDFFDFAKILTQNDLELAKLMAFTALASWFTDGNLNLQNGMHFQTHGPLLKREFSGSRVLAKKVRNGSNKSFATPEDFSNDPFNRHSQTTGKITKTPRS
jgi:hypothetical protein